MAVRWANRSPSLPWTAEAPAHASAPPVSVSPANVGREGVPLNQQIRQVHLGAEERRGGQSADQDHARQPAAGTQGSARHERADGHERDHDGGCRQSARPPRDLADRFSPSTASAASAAQPSRP